MVGTFLRGQQQFRQRLIAQRGVSKKAHQQRNAYADDVKRPPYSLPTGLTWIVKNRLSHGDRVSTHPKLRYSDGQLPRITIGEGAPFLAHCATSGARTEKQIVCVVNTILG